MSDVVVAEDILIETTPRSSSQDNPDRKEVLWRSKLEDLVLRTRDEASTSSSAHGRAAKRARLLYQCFGLPTVLVPLGASVAAQFLPEAAVTAMMVASGLCAGVNAFLDYGAKSQRHFEYSNRWAELSSSISFEMAKGRADRCAADVFLERLRNRTGALRAAEPPAV